MNEPLWQDYHKHTSLSNVYTKDSPLIHLDYWNELKARYGDKPCAYTTVEHGYPGNYMKTYSQLEKFNKKNGTNIKFVFGYEAYWVKDRHTDDKSNCHMILLARNDNGRKALNKILSIANKDGYYYRPRLDLELIMSLPPDDVMITSACIAYWNKYQDIDDITTQLASKFPYFYLEVQPHHTQKQANLNRHILELSSQLNIPIIAGCDSHVIFESQMKDRDDLLESAHITYEDEDGWYLDMPTYDVLFSRFQQQGVLSDEQIKQAIDNTNILMDFEDIVLDRSLKVPVVKSLKGKTQQERNDKFERIVWSEWEQQKWDINEAKHDEYIKEINDAINEIEACNMADYFITTYYTMKEGQEKYGGILTPTGRGSGVSMYLNKILRFTKVDKVNSPVEMYSERFLTKERVLESHTPPDIDHNVSDRQPFIKAQRELVGELGTYDLLALGTLKTKAAWKMYARANGIDPQVANKVSYQISDYEQAKKHADNPDDVNIEDFIAPEFKDLFEGCKRYLGIYDNRKAHPCGCLAYSGDAEADIGVILCKSEATGNEVLTALIESDTIDEFGYLKQDYLIVDSIGLTYDIYKEIGIEPYTVNQLLDKIKTDDATWDIYRDGFTQCVNQCEQPKSTQKVMRYKPKNISELTQFIAGIRPGFQSMYHLFESRQHFEYGIKALDDLIQDEYRTSSFIIYQEDLMKVLEFAGFPMAETYTIIKAISKKKDYIIKEAKPKFIFGFAKAIMDTGETNDKNRANDLAEKVWHIVEDNASYSFNSAHAYCMAIDSVTIAYLKAHYPLEFYKCVLQRFSNKGEKDKVSLIKQEAIKRGIAIKEIKFGDDNRQFNIDHENNAIVQNMAGIKNMPKVTPQALYELGQSGINTRTQLYQALIGDPRINAKAIDILFKLDYFSAFAHPNRLLTEFEIYNKYIDSKVISKKNLTEEQIDLLRDIGAKETTTQFRNFDNIGLIKALIKAKSIPKTSIYQRIKWQIEFLGYSTINDPSIDPSYWMVVDVESGPYERKDATLYSICYGVTRQYRLNKKFNAKHEMQPLTLIQAVVHEKPKMKKNEDGSFSVVPNEFVKEVKCWKEFEIK